MVRTIVAVRMFIYTVATCKFHKLLQIFFLLLLPLSFWQNSAKMTELKIGTKPKQSFQTTKNKKLNFFYL